MADSQKTISLKEKIFDVIFEADTPDGKVFDVSLLVLILASVIIVMLESVEEYDKKYGDILHTLDWVITGLFSIEYFLRIWVLKKPWNYIKSFYGIVDLLSILPMYLSLFIVGSNVLETIRALRLLRVFKVLRVSNYLVEAETLTKSMKASRDKILVFLGTVSILVVIVGAFMYFLEGTVYGNTNFDSIPRSIYWAIVTVTTVGYGDITPISTLGQFFSAILMILGYGILAVPTGIVSAEMVNSQGYKKLDNRACSNCGEEGHDDDARFCNHCGTAL